MNHTPIEASEIAVAYVTTFLPKSLQNKFIESYAQEFIYPAKLLDIESGYYKEVMTLLENTRLDAHKRNKTKITIVSIIALVLSIFLTYAYSSLFYLSLIPAVLAVLVFYFGNMLIDVLLKRALIRDGIMFNYILKDIESVINYRNVAHFNNEIAPLLNEYDKQKDNVRKNNAKISNYDRLLYLVRHRAFSVYIEHLEDIESSKRQEKTMLLNTPYNAS